MAGGEGSVRGRRRGARVASAVGGGGLAFASGTGVRHPGGLYKRYVHAY